MCFACWRSGLVCGAARLKMSPKTGSGCVKPLSWLASRGPGLVGSREGFARLDKAAACLPVLRRPQCFRRASEPSQAAGRSPQGRLGPLDGRFKFKTRFAGRLSSGQSGPILVRATHLRAQKHTFAALSTRASGVLCHLAATSHQEHTSGRIRRSRRTRLRGCGGRRCSSALARTRPSVSSRGDKACRNQRRAPASAMPQP